jgi:hypothetical protein
MSWEDTFQSWAQGPSTTESEKAKNAENVICDALNSDSELAKMDILVFAQGSYKNRTNVRQNSDVDICILNRDHLFTDLPANTKREDFGLVAGSLRYDDFKNKVGQALIKAFGASGVTRGNKAFDVHANSYRLDADVVPALEHRRYTGNGQDYNKGIEFRPDNGGRIINWPDHTYDNGVAKNDRTGRKYKRAIRILKRLRDAMQSDRIVAANDIGSFVIESMVWNVPDKSFFYDSYKDVMRSVLAHLFNETLTKEKCAEWGEVSELKYLFKNDDPKRIKAHNFISAAWNHVGYQ